MALVCTSSDRWFQAYTSEQYTDYLRIKALSEYGLGKYEQLYINQDDEPSQRKIQQTIAKGKVFLRFANELRAAASDYPAALRHLMKLDWESCISSCMAIDEYINGKADSDIALLEIQRNYIANKSQYVDEDDLDIRLGRSNYAFSEIGRSILRNKSIRLEECNGELIRAYESLEIDFETMVLQVRDSVDHMQLDQSADKFNVNLAKSYDDRYAMQRKAIRYLRELLRASECDEDCEDSIDLGLLNESQTILKNLNYLYCNSSLLILNQIHISKE